MARSDEPFRDAEDRPLHRLLESHLHNVHWPAQRRSQFLDQLQARLIQSRDVEGATVVRSVGVTARSPWHRVAHLVVATSLVVAVGLAYWHFGNPWMAIGAQELANWAQQDWRPQEQAWQSMHVAEPTESRPLSDYLRGTPRRWQSLATHLDPRSAVYDLATPGSAQRLYVFRAQRPVVGLPEGPPQQPQTERSGNYFAAWQEGEFVYILSVPGPLRNYWNAVEGSGTPLAESSELQRHDAREIRN